MQRREFLRAGLALGAATALSDDIASGITETAKAENAEPMAQPITESNPPPQTIQLMSPEVTIKFRPAVLPVANTNNTIGDCILTKGELDKLFTAVPPVAEPNNAHKTRTRRFRPAVSPVTATNNASDDCTLTKEDIEKLFTFMGGKTFAYKGNDFQVQLHRHQKEIMGFNIKIVIHQYHCSLDTDSEVLYEFLIDGQPVADGKIFPAGYLAFDEGKVTAKVQGIETTEPAYGFPALWIDEAVKEQAKSSGYTVAEPDKVIIAHFSETIRKHAADILTVEATQELLDRFRETSPMVVDQALKVLDIEKIHVVLQHLLRREIPIKQLGTILEVLGDFGSQMEYPELVENPEVLSYLAQAEIHPIQELLMQRLKGTKRCKDGNFYAKDDAARLLDDAARLLEELKKYPTCEEGGLVFHQGT